MKKKVLWFAKAALAAVIALSIANCFCGLYYNLPVHYSNETGATDYYWDKNHFSSRGTEGFAISRTDENGFVNTFPYTKNTIDVLVMGSSHAEGFNVNADENFTYLLNSKFRENGLDKYVYSIGMSGHEFLRCLRNLENALAVYSPEEYVVIETPRIDFDIQDLEALNDGTYDTLHSYDSGLIYMLQKVDLFRLIYAQLTSFVRNNNAEAEQEKDEAVTVSAEYRTLLKSAMRKASEIMAANGCKLIVVYSPVLETDYNGNVINQAETPAQQAFEAVCEEYGVGFIDMSAAYAAMYEETNRLPFGFSNTAVGAGHTNRYGHSCIARDLYTFITEG